VENGRRVGTLNLLGLLAFERHWVPCGCEHAKHRGSSHVVSLEVERFIQVLSNVAAICGRLISNLIAL
jgi:hypothetical protein